MEHIIVLLLDPNQNIIFASLLTTEFETLTPSWAISNSLTHLTSAPTWEKWVVSNKI
jgi:hypothetical protein